MDIIIDKLTFKLKTGNSGRIERNRDSVRVFFSNYISFEDMKEIVSSEKLILKTFG